MSYLAVNSMGLFADDIGVALVFTYGLPATISRTGATYIIGEQANKAEIAEAERYDRRARCGLVLLIFGFGSQIASNWMQAVQQAGP